MAGIYSIPGVSRTCLVRSTKVDACGVPLASTVASSRYMFTCFASIQLTPHYESSGTTVVKDACGRTQINDLEDLTLTHIEGTIKLAGKFLQPFLEQTLGVRPLLGDELATVGLATDIFGGALDSFVDNSARGVTLEWWAKNTQKGSCAAVTGSTKYIQYALPWCRSWQIKGGWNFDGSAQEVELGFMAQRSPSWTPPVPAEWNVADAIVEPIAWRSKATIPTSNVTGVNDAQGKFETAA